MTNTHTVSNIKLAKIKAAYPIGSVIRLLYMSHDPFPIPQGMTGTVKYIDDIGNIIINWDNGRTLNLIIGVDLFEISQPPENH